MSENFRGSAWKVPAVGGSAALSATKDDQFRVRVLKEGKAYTKNVKIDKPPPPAPSAFTTQYNAFAAKSVTK